MNFLSSRRRGLTLIELIVVLTIIAVLSAAIFPLARNSVKREKEIELSRALRTLREAIDLYKKMVDDNQLDLGDEFQSLTEDASGYPPNLDVLVKGVPMRDKGQEGGGEEEAPRSGFTRSSTPKIMKFLRRIPKDPMTNSTDWGLRSYRDEPNSDRWGGEDVYDVYTKSTEKALDGTKYRDW